MTDLFHGLSERQWRECWGAANWQAIITGELEHIALLPEAAIEDRLSALTMLNQALQHDLLSPFNLSRPFAVFSRDVLLSLSACARPPRWWKRWRWKRIRARAAERTEAIRYMLNMSISFMHENPIEVVNAPVGFTGVNQGEPS